MINILIFIEFILSYFGVNVAIPVHTAHWLMIRINLTLLLLVALIRLVTNLGLNSFLPYRTSLVLRWGF